METVNKDNSVSSNPTKIGKKRKLVNEEPNNSNEPPSKKQRTSISNNIINPPIIQLKSMGNPLNKTIEISQNRIFQKSVIKDMKKLDEKTIRKLLLYVIQNSDEAVKLLQHKLPSNPSKDEQLHCIICHTNYDKQYNGARACILAPDDIYGDCGRGECPCGGWDCLNSSCQICGKTFCGGGGNDHQCRIGTHISDPNSSELHDFSIASCDEECNIENSDNDSNNSHSDDENDTNDSDSYSD